MVVAYALAGTLDFDPLTDSITTDSGGTRVQLDPPMGEILPSLGFDAGTSGSWRPTGDRSEVAVTVSPTSDRLQLLAPFPAWDGHDYIELPVLVKARGSARPTTSRPPARGYATAATSRTSRATCSSAWSTPSPGRPVKARTRWTAAPARSPTSPST